MSSNNGISSENLTILTLYKQQVSLLNKRIKSMKDTLLKVWDDVNNQNTQNTPNTILDKHIICLQFETKIKELEQMVSIMDSECNNAITTERHLQFIKIKYSKINENYHETEEE